MNEKLFCYLHKSSQFIEGNMNTVSIYETMIKIYDKVMKLNLRYNYSYNPNKSNMKNSTLPCLYFGGREIKREEIYFFFSELSNKNDDEMKTENILLRNLILYDFQEVLDYINYKRRRNPVVNFIRFIIQPITKVQTLLIDQDMEKKIETKFSISDKYEGIEFIRKINTIIDEYLKQNQRNITNENITNFDLLIYSCFKTQNNFFGEKLKKYKLNTFENVNLFIQNIDTLFLNNEIDIKPNFERMNLVPSNESLSDDNTSVTTAKVEEESMKSKQFLIQAIKYGSLFTFLFYVKKKII